MTVQPDLEIQLMRYLPDRNDDDEVHEWIGLNKVLLSFSTGDEHGNKRIISEQEVEDIRDTLDSLAERGMIEKSRDNPDYPTSAEYRLTWRGEKEFDFAEYYNDRSIPFERAVFSKEWTGVEFTSVSIDKLVNEINGALSSLDDADVSQSKKAQARALLIAARVLLEAPTPPAEKIRNLILDADRLINVSGWLFGIASFMVSLIK